MQAFQVIRTLETKLLNASTVEEIIHPSAVLIFTDDDTRNIFLYRGKNSDFVDYLIGKRMCLEIRKHMRGFYKVKELQDDESLELIRKESLKLEGMIPEIYNPNFHEEEENQDPNLTENKIILHQEENWKEYLKFDDLKVFGKVNIGQTQQTIEELKTVEGYTSEMLLLGTALYNKEKTIENFFGDGILEKKYKTKFRKLGNLTEGFFFQPGYSTRICINDGRVQALEFLKVEDNETLAKKKDPRKGIILAPVLFRKEILAEHDINNIKKSYSFQETEDIDALIQRARENKPTDEE